MGVLSLDCPSNGPAALSSQVSDLPAQQSKFNSRAPLSLENVGLVTLGARLYLGYTSAEPQKNSVTVTLDSRLVVRA